jgi:hypothetical protein
MNDADVPYTYEMRITAIKLAWWATLGGASWAVVVGAWMLVF